MIEQWNNPFRQVLLFGIIQECFLIGMLLIGNLRDTLPLFMLLYFSAFLMYLGAVRCAYGMPERQVCSRDLLYLIIAFAFLFRATLFFSEPSLSDDIYRYLWDGKLIIEGINPYQFVPGSHELISLRDAQYELINHKDIGTPYGPLTIMIFALSQYIMDSVYFMKVPFILFDCLSMMLIIRILSISSLPKINVIVYAWNPLVVIEVSGSGHNDSLGVLMLLVAIYSVQQRKQMGVSIGLASALLAKYFALLFLPVFLKSARIKDLMMILIILLVVFLPFAEHLESHILNILMVGSEWQFNDSLFSLFLFVTKSISISKALVIFTMALLAGIVWRSQWSPVKSAMIMIGGALLLTTTVQPWYLLWIIPFLCFSLNRAWLLFTGLIMLSYHVLIRYDVEGIWSESLWIKLSIYIPFYSLLLSDAWQHLYSRYSGRIHT